MHFKSFTLRYILAYLMLSYVSLNLCMLVNTCQAADEPTTVSPKESVAEQVYEAIESFKAMQYPAIFVYDLDEKLKAIGSEAKPYFRKYFKSEDELDIAVAIIGTTMFAEHSDIPVLQDAFHKVLNADRAEINGILISKILKIFSKYQYQEVVPDLKKCLQNNACGYSAASMIATLGAIGTRESLEAYDNYKKKWMESNGPVIQFLDVEAGGTCESDGMSIAPKLPRPPFLSLRQLAAYENTAVKDEHGNVWLAFHDSKLGGINDIWVTALKSGVWQQPLFTGVTSFGSFYTGSELTMKISNQGLLFEGEFSRGCVKEGERGLSRYVDCGLPMVDPFVSFTALINDSDSDGLTDIVENRLGTNPEQPDSDGDSITDSEDYDLLTPLDNSIGDDDMEIFKEAYFVRFIGREPGSELMVIETPFLDKKPSVKGFGYIINNPTEQRLDELRSMLGFDGFETVSFNLLCWPISTNTDEEAEGCTSTEAPIHYLNDEHTEAEVEIESYHGGLWATGHYVHLKKISDKWYVTDYHMTWIS